MKAQTTRSPMKQALSLFASLAMAAGTLTALPPLPASAAGSVTLKDGVLTLNGAFTRDQLWAYRSHNDISAIHPIKIYTKVTE